MAIDGRHTAASIDKIDTSVTERAGSHRSQRGRRRVLFCKRFAERIRPGSTRDIWVRAKEAWGHGSRWRSRTPGFVSVRNDSVRTRVRNKRCPSASWAC